MDIPIFEIDNSISAKAFRDGYELGKSEVKSSLKRDIEKEIEDNKNADEYEDYAKAYIAALEWVKNKIETVEP